VDPVDPDPQHWLVGSDDVLILVDSGDMFLCWMVPGICSYVGGFRSGGMFICWWVPTSVADPDPGSGDFFLTPGSGIRNGFIPDPGSRIPNPKLIFLRA
jgi:hypothetical protein